MIKSEYELNDFVNVKSVDNPFKCVNFKGTFKQDQIKCLCYFYDRHQINLNEGLWTISVNDILVQNNKDKSIQAVFDIKTDLIPSYESDLLQGASYFTSKFQSIYSIDLNLKTKGYIYKRPSQLFLSLTARPTSFFSVYFEPRGFFTNLDYDFNVEVNFLFHRIK